MPRIQHIQGFSKHSIIIVSYERYGIRLQKQIRRFSLLLQVIGNFVDVCGNHLTWPRFTHTEVSNSFLIVFILCFWLLSGVYNVVVNSMLDRIQ